MAMADSEIDSFLQKFKLLRGAGIEASLNFTTKLGEVWITLNCKVGRNVPPPQSKPAAVAAVSKKYRSPSYYRRQVRRKAERDANSQSSKEDSLAEQANEHESADETETSEDEIDNSAQVTKDGNVSAGVKQESEVNDRSEDDDEVLQKPNEDLSLQLDNMIRESQKNRDLWDKFHTLPP